MGVGVSEVQLQEHVNVVHAKPCIPYTAIHKLSLKPFINVVCIGVYIRVLQAIKDWWLAKKSERRGIQTAETFLYR